MSPQAGRADLARLSWVITYLMCVAPPEAQGQPCRFHQSGLCKMSTSPTQDELANAKVVPIRDAAFSQRLSDARRATSMRIGQNCSHCGADHAQKPPDVN